MDDTVLESHTENPAHVQMMFLDDGKRSRSWKTCLVTQSIAWLYSTAHCGTVQCYVTQHNSRPCNATFNKIQTICIGPCSIVQQRAVQYNIKIVQNTTELHYITSKCKTIIVIDNFRTIHCMV